MQNPLISVIIPIYNASAYLATCLCSLQRQSFRDFELILIDDGSTDKSLSICRAYAEKDGRILVLHQENQGVSAARNAGLALASGAYITFIDGDDYVKDDYLEVLSRDALSQNADVVCCNYIEVLNGAERHPSPAIKKPRPVAKDQLFEDAYMRECFGTMPWAKLIKAELAHSARYRPLKFSEDSFYMAELFSQSPLVYINNYEGYYYVRCETSATMSSEKNISAKLDPLKFKKYLFDCALHRAPEFKAFAAETLARGTHVAAAAIVLCKDRTLYRNTRPELLGYIQEIRQVHSAISGRFRLYLFLYRVFPGLHAFLITVWNQTGRKIRNLLNHRKRTK